MLRRLLPAAILAAIGCVNGCAAGVEDEQLPQATSDVTGGPAREAPVTVEGTSTVTATKKSNQAPADKGGPLFRATADATVAAASLNTFDRWEAALLADGTLAIAQGKGVAGVDPQPTGYFGGSFYNGGTYRHAEVSSPVWSTAKPFDSVTPSFEASTPPGTWLEVKVAAHVVKTGQWTKEYSLGVWAYDDATVRRHSVDGQGDGDADVATDTLKLKSPADAFYVNVILFADGATKTPTIRAVSAITTSIEPASTTLAGNPAVWGKTLDVPKRSEMLYPDAANEGWDSPTSIAMLLGHWGIVETPPDAARLCHDVVLSRSPGATNRPFNTGHAAAIADGKMHAMVTRLASFAQVEPLVASEVPVGISIAYGSGELAGAPATSSAGRLVVVKGFASNGDVVVNDPAFATDETVETTYDRAQLTAAWRRAGGTTYLVWPSATKLPSDPLGAY